MTSQISEITAAIPVLKPVDRRGVPVPASVPATPVSLSSANRPTPQPPLPGGAAAPDQTQENQQLADAVKALNERYATQRTDLRFTVDKDSGNTVVAIVDSKDGTVLRQIPSEEALRISRALSQTRGSLIEQLA
jgi:flagellar protein FlaG